MYTVRDAIMCYKVLQRPRILWLASIEVGPIRTSESRPRLRPVARPRLMPLASALMPLTSALMPLTSAPRRRREREESRARSTAGQTPARRASVQSDGRRRARVGGRRAYLLGGCGCYNRGCYFI
eukprot:1179015-Prorocentrum_minimum.AAC.2